MKFLNLICCGGLLWSLAQVFESSAANAAEPPSLFLPAKQMQPLLAEVPLDSTHSRPVQLNPSVLASLGGPGPQRLVVETFNGNRLTVTLTARQDYGPQRFAWSGVVEGYSPSAVTLVVYDDAVSLELQSPIHGLCRLRLTRDGSYRLDEIDPQLISGCGNHSSQSEDPDQLETSAASAALRPPSPPSLLSTGTDVKYVDLLAVYSKTARTQAGSSSAIRASILKSVSQANTVHENSQTGIRLRLLDMIELNYFDYGDLSNDFRNLVEPADGWIDEVHALREQYRADLVHLFVDSQGIPGDPSVVGRAVLGGEFGVTKWSASSYVFAHETAHNFGCAHQVGKDGEAGYNHAWQVKHDWYDPTFGVLLGTSQAETLMWSSITSTLIPYFSDADRNVVFKFPLMDDVRVPLGDPQTANNTRFVRENAPKKIPVRPAWLHVDSRSPAGGEATPLNPVRSLSLAFNVWYERTILDPSETALVTVVPGRYFEAVRITGRSSIRKSGPDGIVHIGTP